MTDNEHAGTLGADPYEALGLRPGATDEEIRAAYLQRVREHPPDREPEAFERIRDAWEVLRDPRKRARLWLFGVDPGASFRSVLEAQPAERRFVGTEPWLAHLVASALRSGER